MYRHIVPGDKVRFQAPLENAKRDAANAEQQRASRENYERPDRRREQDVIRIYNQSGVDLERGDIVALGDPVIDPSEALDSWYHRPAFVGEYPLWQPQWKHPARIGVMLEPCAQDKVASAVVSGCVQARLLVRDINHEYADVNWIDGGIRLTSTDAGAACAQILAIEESSAPAGQCGIGSDERWAYVRLQNGGQFTLIGRVTQAFAPFECLDGGSGGGGGFCPPKGKVQIYFLNPTTECLQAVTDRQQNLIYVCPYNNECRPIPINDWVRLHCDRWHAWWATPQEPVERMVRAVDCIQPGDDDKTARVQRAAAGGYQDDPAYPDPVTIDNTDCLVFALPGEIFMARRESCCDPKWLPSGPYGLTRRVRIDTCIDCDASGQATVLQSTCSGGSGGEGCGKQDGACEPIDVCNTTGRPIAPCGPEEAVAQLTPGTDDADCCWYLQAGPYPTRATATLGADLCPTDTDATVSGGEFPTFCGPDWPKPTSAKNPYGLAGCSGSKVELAPKFTDCKCEWEIIQVQPQVRDVLHDYRLNCGGSNTCTLEKKSLKNVLVWSCDDTVCDSPEWEVVATGTMVDLVSSIDCSAGGSGESCSSAVAVTSRQGCVFCAGSPSTSNVLSVKQITYVDGFSSDLVPGAGGSGTDACGSVTATRKTACVITCDGSPSAADPVTVLTGESVLVSQGVYDDGCLKQTQVAVCVLAQGEPVNAAVPGFDCTDCDAGSGGSGA